MELDVQILRGPCKRADRLGQGQGIFPEQQKSYRFVLFLHFFVIVEQVQDAADRIVAKGSKDYDDSDREVSVLEKLILKEGPGSNIPVVMAFDMVIAGIDTTGNTGGFLLYNLSKYVKVKKNRQVFFKQSWFTFTAEIKRPRID